MKKSKCASRDPICGMIVDNATALPAERDGKTAYFCSDLCRQIFILTPNFNLLEDKSECCNGSHQRASCCGRHQHANRKEEPNNAFQQFNDNS